MATDVERLVVSLEASIRGFERSMNRATGAADQSARKIERRFETMNANVGERFSSLQRGIATAFASAVALRGAQQLVDASTRIQNSLKVAGLQGEELSGVYDQLFAAAQRNAAPLDSLVTLYGRASIVQKELGVSTKDLLSFTDNVAVALRVAGTDAQTASGALLQLSQALGSGTVRAEEFNSILEGALPIAQAAAVGLTEAGGSVAKLRALMVDGKVSSEAFFKAFEAGSVTLKDKVANSELTVSQALVRLQNVLIDAAGKFDNGVGASARFAASLDQLGVAITKLSENEGLNQFLINFDKFGQKSFDGTAREFEAIANAVQAVQRALTNTTAELDNTQAAADAAQAELEAFANVNGGNFTGEVEDAFRDLINQLAEGHGTIKTTREAIMAMGTADPNFDRVIGKVDLLTSAFIRARDAAFAALHAAAQTPVPTNGGYAGQEGAGPQILTGGSGVKPVSISDYPAGGSGSKKSGGGGGGKSPAEKYGEAVAQQEKRIAQLQRETELQRTLNPLVNDYGFAMERLKAQMELENAAKEAGIPLDERRQQQINDLSTGYANASVEAARLAEAQDQAKKTADELAQAGRAALDTIVDGFIEGRDAGEIFNDVLKNLTKSLINMGLNGLFGGGGAGGGGFLSGLFGGGGGMKLFARGGVSNQPAIFGEAGPEAAVPLPDGRRIPVDLRMPSLASAGGGGAVIKVELSPDLEGRIVATAGRQSVSIVSASAPSIAEQGATKAGQKLAGGDFNRGMATYGLKQQAKRR